jgi:hypothetical protein
MNKISKLLMLLTLITLPLPLWFEKTIGNHSIPDFSLFKIPITFLCLFICSLIYFDKSFKL